MEIITRVKDLLAGKYPLAAKRSSGWTKVRAQHLSTHATCAVCGSVDVLEVHHIQPFHLYPDLELNPQNLVTLCESGKLGKLNCHLVFGHLGLYKSFNVDVVANALQWLKKITKRP